MNRPVGTTFWGPEQIIRLIVATTGCLCLLVLLVGTLLLLSRGAIDPAHIGSAKGIGVGSGLLGFGSVGYAYIRAALSGGKKDG